MLILTETLPPYGGGGALATYLFARLLKKSGLDVTVTVREFGAFPYSDYGFKVVKINYKGYGKYSVPLSITLIKRLIKDSDVVYFAAASFNLIPFAKKLSKPVVAHVHSYYPICPLGTLYNFAKNSVCDSKNKSCSTCIWVYEKMRGSYLKTLSSTVLNTLAARSFLKSLSYADAIIFPSNRQKTLFMEAAGKNLNSDNTHVIHNPLPETDIIPMNGEDLGFFGGLDPIKGFSILYKAWINVFRDHPLSKLHAALTDSLRFSAKDPNIIRYGLLTNSEYENVYGKIRAVIFPSICPEPYPYVVLEACLRGKILISSRIGGIPEQTQGLEGVRLVKPGDSNELTDAIDWVLSLNKTEAEEIGLKNRQEILKKLDNLTVLNQLIRVFQILAKSG